MTKEMGTLESLKKNLENEKTSNEAKISELKEILEIYEDKIRDFGEILKEKTYLEDIYKMKLISSYKQNTGEINT